MNSVTRALEKRLEALEASSLLANERPMPADIALTALSINSAVLAKGHKLDVAQGVMVLWTGAAERGELPVSEPDDEALARLIERASVRRILYPERFMPRLVCSVVAALKRQCETSTEAEKPEVKHVSTDD
jgi:hypothetical protein